MTLVVHILQPFNILLVMHITSHIIQHESDSIPSWLRKRLFASNLRVFNRKVLFFPGIERNSQEVLFFFFLRI